MGHNVGVSPRGGGQSNGNGGSSRRSYRNLAWHFQGRWGPRAAEGGGGQGLMSRLQVDRVGSCSPSSVYTSHLEVFSLNHPRVEKMHRKEAAN